MVFGWIGIGITGDAGTGTGWIGTGVTGMGIIGPGCIGAGDGAMGGLPGLIVCAEAPKATSMLIVSTDRSLHMILFFIYFSVWWL
jgi:hypothetical protein